MAYVQTDWRVGDPITQEKMNHIEEGIYNAHIDISSRYTKSEVENIKSTLEASISAA
jgi:hypothetical protein